jgi:hypothetical protein
MPAVEENVKVTVELPRSTLERVSERANSARRSLDREIGVLLEQELHGRERLRQSLESARAAYQADLARSGTPWPSTDELWEQMRRIREEVANELYPE